MGPWKGVMLNLEELQMLEEIMDVPEDTYVFEHLSVADIDLFYKRARKKLNMRVGTKSERAKKREEYGRIIKGFKRVEDIAICRHWNESRLSR